MPKGGIRGISSYLAVQVSDLKSHLLSFKGCSTSPKVYFPRQKNKKSLLFLLHGSGHVCLHSSPCEKPHLPSILKIEHMFYQSSNFENKEKVQWLGAADPGSSSWWVQLVFHPISA